MKLLTATVISLSLLASAYAHANQASAPSGADAPSVAAREGSQTLTITTDSDGFDVVMPALRQAQDKLQLASRKS